MKMKYSDGVAHSNKNIREFLASLAPIELYCVNGGLIHSFDVKEGRFYRWSMRDDRWYQSCIEYLKKQKLPVFECHEDLDKYEKELKEVFKESLEKPENAQ
jgi:hypothetical protein